MRTKIDISKKFDLNKISFDLSGEINESAKAIVKDHDKRLSFGQGVNGKQMAALKPSTIHSKRNSGYSKPRTPLYATGTMKNIEITKKANKASQEARIAPDEDRRKIGAYHQEGIKPHKIVAKNAKVLYPLFNSKGKKFGAKSGDHPGTPAREWFGISVEVEKNLLKRMGRQIERRLKNA